MPFPIRPSQPTTEWFFQVKDLRYLHVFGLFFSHPKLACALLSLRSFWWQTVLMGMTLCLLGTFFLTMNEVPDYGIDIHQGATFILQTLGSAELSNGRVRWAEEHNASLPVSTPLKHCQLDIVDSWDAFLPSRATAFRNGVVLCPEGVGTWALAEDGTLSLRQLVLPAKYIPPSKEQLVLNSSTKSFFCRFVFLVLFGSVLASNGVILMESICSTAIVLCVVWMFLGRIRKFRALPHFLMIGFNLAFPPFVTALIWALAGLPFAFDSLFCVTFLLYLIYASVEGRNGAFRPA